MQRHTLGMRLSFFTFTTDGFALLKPGHGSSIICSFAAAAVDGFHKRFHPQSAYSLTQKHAGSPSPAHVAGASGSQRGEGEEEGPHHVRMC